MAQKYAINFKKSIFTQSKLAAQDRKLLECKLNKIGQKMSEWKE